MSVEVLCAPPRVMPSSFLTASWQLQPGSCLAASSRTSSRRSMMPFRCIVTVFDCDMAVWNDANEADYNIYSEPPRHGDTFGFFPKVGRGCCCR